MATTRFLLGDDLGNIKILRYSSNAPPDTSLEIKNVYQQPIDKPKTSVQALAINASLGKTLSAAAFSDGLTLLFSLGTDNDFKTLSQWTEPWLKDNRFIGLSLTERTIFSCTSNGALRMTPFNAADPQVAGTAESKLLPTRLCDWRLSSNHQNFAYGGDEVDLSVWNTELAFQPSEDSDKADSAMSIKKRKRNDALFPGEIWRAKNVPNDALNLRQPVRITSLSFLSSSGSNQHLLTGTQLGDIRRYDTRVARRPVADWRSIGKVGGVKQVEEGSNENEVFVSDHGSNLFSLDLRNGNVLYGYKSLAGAITSIAPSPSIVASTSLDRYIRIHSVYPPASGAGQRLDRKGEVITKSYLNCVPTVISWDKLAPCDVSEAEMDDREGGDDIWEGMDSASDEDMPKSKRRNIPT